jgi:hypothetical protein
MELYAIETTRFYCLKRAIRKTVARFSCLSPKGDPYCIPFEPICILPGSDPDWNDRHRLPPEIEDGPPPYNYRLTHKDFDRERYLALVHSCEQLV